MSDIWDSIYPILAALLPTVGVAVLFWFVMKAIFEGDRRERLAQSRWEAAQKPSDTPGARDADHGRSES